MRFMNFNYQRIRGLKNYGNFSEIVGYFFLITEIFLNFAAELSKV